MQRVNDSLWLTKFKLELSRFNWRYFIRELVERLDFNFVSVTYKEYNRFLKKILIVEVIVRGNNEDSRFIDRMLNQFFTEKEMTVRCL